MATKLATLVAVGAAVKEAELKEAKKALKPGKYRVDISVHIHGEIEKKEDSEMKGTNSIKWILLSMMALKELPAKKQLEVCRSFMRAIGDEDKIKELTEEANGADNVRLRIEEIRESCPMIPTTGKVSSILEVDFIEDTENHIAKK